MAKGAYLGVGGVAKKGKKAYFGVGGVAKKVKKAYIGVNGVAKLWWSGSVALKTLFTPVDTSSTSYMEGDGDIPTTLTSKNLTFVPRNIFYDSKNERFIIVQYIGSSPVPVYTRPVDGDTWTNCGSFEWQNGGYRNQGDLTMDPDTGDLIFWERISSTNGRFAKVTVSSSGVTKTTTANRATSLDYNPIGVKKVKDYYVTTIQQGSTTVNLLYMTSAFDAINVGTFAGQKPSSITSMTCQKDNVPVLPMIFWNGSKYIAYRQSTRSNASHFIQYAQSDSMSFTFSTTGNVKQFSNSSTVNQMINTNLDNTDLLFIVKNTNENVFPSAGTWNFAATKLSSSYPNVTHNSTTTCNPISDGKRVYFLNNYTTSIYNFVYCNSEYVWTVASLAFPVRPYAYARTIA